MDSDDEVIRITGVIDIIKSAWREILHSACKRGDISRVRSLLSECEVNAVDDAGKTPLYIACERGFQDIAELLLDSGAAVNLARRESNPDLLIDGYTALHVAALKGEVDIVKLLLSRGADVDAQEAHGITPLHVSCSRGHWKIADVLLDHGADVSVTCEGQESLKGITALHTATVSGNEETVQLLLRRKAEVDAVDSLGRTCLYHACENGFQDIANILLDGGAAVNFVRNEPSTHHHLFKGYTALHASAINGKVELVKLLLSRGANAHVLEEHGVTPLHLSCARGHWEAAKELLDHGAEINATCEWATVESTVKGVTALHLAAASGIEETVQILLSRMADVDAFDSVGKTPIVYACSEGFPSIAEHLLNAGAGVNFTPNIDDRPYDGRHCHTALHVSARMGQVDLVKLLLRRGASVNILEGPEVTPLHLSCLGGHWEVANELLNHGADARAACGWPFKKTTALLLAVFSGSEETVKLLLSGNADAAAKAEFNANPLAAACQLKYLSIARLLLTSGAGVNVAISSEALDDRGYTPLHFAANGEYLKRGVQNHVELIKLLFSFGADVNAENDAGKTPLLVVLDWSAGHSPEREALAGVFVRQLAVMQAQNAVVSGTNLRALADHDELKQLSESCESEIRSMRERVIGDSGITFFDVLTEGPRPLAGPTGNEGVANIAESADIETWFPIYASEIRERLSRGTTRRALQRDTDAVLASSSLRRFPESVRKNMYSYLSNDDFRRIIRAKLDPK